MGPVAVSGIHCGARGHMRSARHKAMIIIHFANHFLPSIGGVEYSVARTAEAQARLGHRVRVITESVGDRTFDDAAQPFEITRFRVPVLRPFTRLFYWRWMWRQRALLNAADVLHFHDYTTFFHWFLPLRAVIRRPLYAVTFHGFEHWPVKRRHQWLRCATARCARVRIGVGTYIAALYRHPIDHFMLGAPVRELPRLKRAEEAVFAYVGRLAEDTGILPVAMALRTLAHRGDADIVLRLAGEGPLRETLVALSDERFRIEDRGPVTEVTAVLAEARYIISGGFLGLFDAFQTGIPVIVPAFSDIRRLYIHSIRNVEDYCTILGCEAEVETALEAVLLESDEEAAARAVAAERFVRGLSWDGIASDIVEWYCRARPANGVRMSGG